MLTLVPFWSTGVGPSTATSGQNTKIESEYKEIRGDLGDDGEGSITNLLAYVDDVTGAVPLVNLDFATTEFKRIAKLYNLDCNTYKTRIQTSTNG